MVSLTQDGLYVISRGIIDVYYRDEERQSRRLKNDYLEHRISEVNGADPIFWSTVRQGFKLVDASSEAPPGESEEEKCIREKGPAIFLASALDTYDLFQRTAEVAQLESNIPSLLPLQTRGDFYARISREVADEQNPHEGCL